MMFIKSNAVRLVIVILLLAGARAASAQALYEMPDGVETRWASPENPRGEKGRARSPRAARTAPSRVSVG